MATIRLMRLLRLFLVVLLGFAIPLAGFAAPAHACPMQTSEQTASGGEAKAHIAVQDMDCCHHGNSKSRSSHDKSCNPGQSCSSPGALVFALPATLHFDVPAGHLSPAGCASAFFRGTPAAIWHPPRQA